MGGDPEHPVEGAGLASWVLEKYISEWRHTEKGHHTVGPRVEILWRGKPTSFMHGVPGR